MDFELTADQVDLQEGIRKLCEGRFPMPVVRDLEKSDGVDSSSWRELVDAGVFTLRVPEASGGVGRGAAESMLVFEELGRALVPGPLVGSELAASVLGGSGAEVVGVVARADGPVLIEHLSVLDRLLVIEPDVVSEVDPRSVLADASRPARPLDPLTPVWVVESLPDGERIGGNDVSERLRVDGAALTAALQLGLSEAVLDLAVAYAKQREQFGRPIGSFQAVKHLLADMLVRTEVARAAVYAAGVTIDDPEVGDPARAGAAAKITAGDAAVRNGKAAIQVHGGMGFTWEVDAHLYLKRAWALDTAFGTPDQASEYLATLL
jgi:alkylation response protein AidB-like acyl-CoA dehydrogenase